MSVLQKLFYFFSGYVNPDERKFGKFFAKLNENSPKYQTMEKLAYLMQENLVVMNLWNERNYKGYDYLTKRKRKELYRNTELIKSDFENYCQQNSDLNFDNIINEISELNINTQVFNTKKDNLIYLRTIMKYLSPSAGRYTYHESSTFGKLLKDPSKEQLIGDCNQIVTLYIYLYSLRFNVKDLQLITLPGHVALHFEGVNIEATNGHFKMYPGEKQNILPIQEIISINLLDTTDSYFRTHKIGTKSFLQSARLAYLVSSEDEIVSNNLEIAYNNLVGELVEKHDYNLALKYAKLSMQKHLIELVGHNGTVYFMSNNQFNNAKKYAHYTNNERDFVKKINYNQGISQFNNGNFKDAIKSFQSINEYDLVKKCYIGLFLKEQKKLTKITTTADIKQNSSVIKNMQSYARKSQDRELIENVKNLTRYL